MRDINKLIDYIDNDLLHNIDIKSIRSFDPVVVNNIPEPWILLGMGNYAAVLTHPDFTEYAIKIYAQGRIGIEEEIKVYDRIKEHSSFSKCFYYTKDYLILKRLNGKTLYECINEGIQMPMKVIKEVDEALEYAKNVGLNPHDVHAKNVMIVDGRGVIADISDFTKKEECTLWNDFKEAYFKIYVPLLYKLHPPIPDFCLNLIRKSYRVYRNICK